MDFDVVIVGAGPGGCIAARDLAKNGFSVGLFDASPKESLGRPIIVEAERAMFDQVGVKRPEGDEVPYHQKRMRVFSGNRKQCFTLEGEHPCMALYLSRFVSRMLADAEGAGAKFFGGFKAREPILENGRVAGVVFDNSGQEERVMARLVIDATGFNAALVRMLPEDAGMGFFDRKADVVVAENHFHEIDVSKAEQAVKDGLHYDEEIWNRLGGHGNFSTEYSFLSLKQKRAYILIGRKAEYDQVPVSDAIDRFKEEQGYYGKWLYGGAGPIRVRRSLDKLVADGFMVIGEAACQVIPAHGSGVSSALYAGHLAAKVAASALKEKQSPDTASLWQYSHQYQTGRGMVLACYDANKLTLDHITIEQETRLLESGAMQPEDLLNGTIPKPVSMSAGTIPARVWALIKNPDLIGTVVMMGSAINKVKRHYSAYPSKWDPREFEAWKRGAQKIFEPLEKSP